MENFIPNKESLKDVKGRPLTQSLFLEINYDPEVAVYTLKDYDHEYDGKIYPSLKRLYLNMEDPVEYEFASTYLLGWKHWLRICENKLFKDTVEEWREELQLKIRSQAIKDIIDMTADEKSFQAAKWLADRGWDKRRAGRPSKEEIAKEKRIQERLNDEYQADIIRMSKRGDT